MWGLLRLALMMFINTVPGSVSITVIQPLPTSVIVLWQVWLVDNNVGIMLFAAINFSLHH